MESFTQPEDADGKWCGMEISSFNIHVFRSVLDNFAGG